MLCISSYKALNNDFDKTKTMKEKQNSIIINKYILKIIGILISGI